MATDVDEIQTKYDVAKWLLATLLVLTGILGNAYFSQVMMGMRVLGWLLLVAMAAAIVLRTAKGREFLVFLREARVELYKVIWPTRQETMQTAMVVIVIVLITGVFLWGVDTVLLWIVSRIAGNGVS